MTSRADSAAAEQDPEPAGPLRFGVRSMSAPLRRVLLRSPSVTGDFAAAHWRAPDTRLLTRQHQLFGEQLTELGCQVEVVPAVEGLVDATYVRDPGLVIGTGAVLFQMAKPVRAAEPAHLGAALAAAGVPVVARLDGTARADGGDFIWLDEHTMLGGRSYRTNAEGLRQLAQIVAAEGASLASVDLPHDRGPGHVLHLMSLISPVADDLAVVYPPLAPVALMELLADRGIRAVAVDTDEYETMGCNVLAIEPRRVLMLRGNPRTRAELESAGCEVHEYDGSEISVKGDGGPTCLTAPIWRWRSAQVTARHAPEGFPGRRTSVR